MPATRLSSCLAALALGLALGPSAGCGTPASRAYAELEVHEAPSGMYRVRYLSPPWQVLSTEGDRLELAIRSNAMRLSDDPAADRVPPKYELVVAPNGRAPMAAIDRLRRGAAGRGEEVLDGPRDLITDFGDEGVELLTRRREPPRRFFRYVALARPGGGSVLMTFEANPDLDEAEVDEMVLATEIGPLDE